MDPQAAGVKALSQNMQVRSPRRASRARVLNQNYRNPELHVFLFGLSIWRMARPVPPILTAIL
jgi:hypothetical protein